MAYFANGSEGEVLHAQCADCPLGYGWNDARQGKLFEREPTPRQCPVQLAQMIHNYNQVRDSGCDVTADWLENMDEPPPFPERVDGINVGSPEVQLKTAIKWLRADDFRDAMNLLIDKKGRCLVRAELVQIRRETNQ